MLVFGAGSLSTVGVGVLVVGVLGHFLPDLFLYLCCSFSWNLGVVVFGFAFFSALFFASVRKWCKKPSLNPSGVDITLSQACHCRKALMHAFSTLCLQNG